MKVSEAKTKVCPFIMGSGSMNFDELVSINDTTANINCICGECMAWVFTSQNQLLDDNFKEGYCKRLQP